jgi:hypothetical protein
MSLLPREHGAYGQVTFPLLTALIVAGPTAAGLCVGAAAVMGFLAHEPLLVLLGRRGVRARAEQERAARLRFAVTGAIALVAGVLAALALPADARWSLLLPVVPAGVLLVAIAAQSEKSILGEAAAAVAFSSIAVPVCLAGGLPTGVALAVSIVFAAIFLSGTLAVRGVILAVRGGGNPRMARATRLSTVLLAAAVAAALVVAASRALVPWAATVAVCPGLIAGIWIATFPPSPAQLRTVGWTLVATSTAAVLILVLALPRS